jgi:hypothetical protein
MIVKTTTLAGLAVMVMQPAQADIWCLRNFGDPPYRNCVFPSAEQCFLAVRIGGGICERDEHGPGKDAERNRRPARRPEPRDR